MSKPIEKETPKTRNIDVTVRGLAYYVTPSTMRRMAKATPIGVRFQRDPKNAQDPNAIKVIIDAQPWQGFHIGFVAKQTAAVIAPKMDKGTFETEGAWLMWVKPDKAEAGVLMKVVKRQS
jgi:hypothetical protein